MENKISLVYENGEFTVYINDEVVNTSKEEVNTMYDLKELEENQSNQEGTNIEISDRAYYSNHLTDSVFKTKISYVPTDSLL